MNPDTLGLVVSAYVVAAVLVSIFVALKLDRRLRLRQPATRRDRWGYYVGCMGLACAPGAVLSALALVLAARQQAFESVGLLLVFTAVLAIQAVSGGFILARKRWAWVVGTVFSFNLVLWVINGIYAGRRWAEFAGQDYGAAGTEDEGYELLAEATKLETSGRIEEALLAYQRLALTHGHTSAGRDAQISFESLRSRRLA
jgi:hypothetical protein